VRPYSPKVAVIARNVTKTIRRAIPNADVRFLGASALKLSGQNDIDIWILCPPKLKHKYIAKLKGLWGDPVKRGRKWKWTEHGYEIAVNVVDPANRIRKEKLRLFEILQENAEVRHAYETLKTSYSGRTYKEYLIAKMEFLNELARKDAENQRHLDLIEKMGAAVSDSHVITPHGKHCTTSFTKYKLYRDANTTRLIARRIAREFKQEKPHVVVGIANGGAILAMLVAEELSKISHARVISLYIEKDPAGSLNLKDVSNQRLIQRKKILVVDDTADTGEAMRHTVSFLRRKKGKIVGAAAVCARNPISASSLNAPKFYSYAVYSEKQNSYSPQSCPMCKAGVPINKDFGVRT
jgi:orotate phosphoribosyltransferase